MLVEIGDNFDCVENQGDLGILYEVTGHKVEDGNYLFWEQYGDIKEYETAELVREDRNEQLRVIGGKQFKKVLAKLHLQIERLSKVSFNEDLDLVKESPT